MENYPVRNPTNVCFCGHGATNHTATTCIECTLVNGAAGNHIFGANGATVGGSSPQLLSAQGT